MVFRSIGTLLRPSSSNPRWKYLSRWCVLIRIWTRREIIEGPGLYKSYKAHRPPHGRPRARLSEKPAAFTPLPVGSPLLERTSRHPRPAPQLDWQAKPSGNAQAVVDSLDVRALVVAGVHRIHEIRDIDDVRGPVPARGRAALTLESLVCNPWLCNSQAALAPHRTTLLPLRPCTRPSYSKSSTAWGPALLQPCPYPTARPLWHYCDGEQHLKHSPRRCKRPAPLRAEQATS